MCMGVFFCSFLLPVSSLFPLLFSLLFTSSAISHESISSDVCDFWMPIRIYEGGTKKLLEMLGFIISSLAGLFH